MTKDFQQVRKSGYGDYIALDFLTINGDIKCTPFYIKNNQQIEVHWMRPSSERCERPISYDDFNDKYLFKMENGKLLVRWINGPCSHMEQFTEVVAHDLIDWNFQHARKIFIRSVKKLLIS